MPSPSLSAWTAIVEAMLPGQTAPTSLGTLQLADFINPAGLQAKGQNLYIETAASGTAAGFRSRAAGRGHAHPGLA